MTSLLDRADSAERPVYRLPPEAYYDPAWYERERRELFGRTWNLVGHVSECMQPGDYFTALVGTEPVVVVRQNDGTLRGFLNLCRHRGMVIACGSGNCGESLRCGYHGWEFALDGALERVPQRKTQFPDIDAGALGLFDVSVQVWGGFIFVHPDPAAEATFTAWLGDLPEHCGDYPWDDIVEIARTRVPLRCNWKLYIENHIDWLHLWYLHQDSLKMYEHHEASYATSGRHWYSAEVLRVGEGSQTPRSVMQPIPGVSEDELRTLRANLMFPNVPMATMGTMVQTYQVVPTGPETCELDIRNYGAPGAVVSEEMRAQGLLILRDEDGVACEQMQMAIHSARFEVGPLAVEHERPIADFHANLLTYLG
jgi:choline monooxygenase